MKISMPDVGLRRRLTIPGMDFRACALAFTLPLLASLSLCVAAQQPPVADAGADCPARVAALEQEMGVARAKGQMLRRQQLANDLAALRARCSQGAAEPGREARIAQLEHEIRELRAQLDRAEEQLRRLKDTAL